MRCPNRIRTALRRGSATYLGLGGRGIATAQPGFSWADAHPLQVQVASSIRSRTTPKEVSLALPLLRTGAGNRAASIARASLESGNVGSLLPVTWCFG